MKHNQRFNESPHYFSWLLFIVAFDPCPLRTSSIYESTAHTLHTVIGRQLHILCLEVAV